MAESGWVWVYGVVGRAMSGDGAIGVGGSPVRMITAAGLTAIVGDVGEVEYGAAALRRNLEDLDWLARTARAHHAVLATAAEQGPVVPMRLATLYTSDAGVADMLRERADDLRSALGLIRARSEWGVKAYASSSAPAGEDERPADPRAAGAGAAYLRRRGAQLTASKHARQEAVASASAVYNELSQFAVSSRLYPPQAPDLAGQSTPMILNAAYLVADERAGEFTAAVADLTARHRSVELAMTGPWPAYSFVGSVGFVGEDDGPGTR